MLDSFFEYFGLTGGVLIILGVGIVVFLLVAIIMERRTKMLFPERQKGEDDNGFLSFKDSEDEED